MPNSSVPTAFSTRPPMGLPPRSSSTRCRTASTRGRPGTLDVPLSTSRSAGRAGYAALTGVPVESVAMGGTSRPLLGLVAAAVPDGSRVATLAGEFTSTTFPFAAQAGRGVTITELSADELVIGRRRLRRRDREPGAVGQRRVLDVDALRARWRAPTR